MTHHSVTGAAGSTFTLALVGVAIRAVRDVAAAMRNRREVRDLQRLDDRALKDIGLARADVEAALGLPIHLDPSRHLVDITGRQRGQGAEKPAVVVRSERLDRVRRADASVTTGLTAACG